MLTPPKRSHWVHIQPSVSSLTRQVGAVGKWWVRGQSDTGQLGRHCPGGPNYQQVLYVNCQVMNIHPGAETEGRASYKQVIPPSLF